MSKFYEVSEDTQKEFFNVFNKKSFPISVGFQFIGSEKQKQLIKISKLADQYTFLLNKELLVSVNEDLFNVFVCTDHFVEGLLGSALVGMGAERGGAISGLESFGGDAVVFVDAEEGQ